MNEKKCEFIGSCGGCDYTDIPYEKQLEIKQTIVKEALKQYNINASVLPCVGMYYPYAYRNKVHFAVQKYRGKVQLGFFEEGTNKVTSVNKCLLFDKWLSVLHEIVITYILKYKLVPYDKFLKEGLLKYVVARKLGSGIMVTVVATSINFAGLSFLYAKLCEVFGRVSLYVNLNKRTDNAVFDDRNFYHKYGEKGLSYQMLGVKFELLPNAFFQVNEHITEKIYQSVVKQITQEKANVVVDLYSGIGITSLCLSKNGSNVISIEQNEMAVKTELLALKLNNLSNVKCVCGLCEKEIEKLNVESISQMFQLNSANLKTAVFIDPPRSGVSQNVLEKIVEFGANLVMYLSCSPDTLARDLTYLTKYYKAKTITPYDMFPQTKHVETLVCLTKL